MSERSLAAWVLDHPLCTATDERQAALVEEVGGHDRVLLYMCRHCRCVYVPTKTP